MSGLAPASNFAHQLEAVTYRHAGVSGYLGVALVSIDDAADLTAHLGPADAARAFAAFHERLAGIVRSSECLLSIADHKRALVLPDLIGEPHAALAANKILRTFDEPVLLDESPLHLRVSVGIALAEQPLADDAPLVEAANEALARARTRNDHIAIIDASELDTAPAVSGELERRLDQALANSEFELFFLPTVFARNGLPTGAEALLRWRDPERGLLPPARFIPFAEQTPVIKPLTWFCIKAAVRQAAEWRRLHGPMSVSVNLAGPVLADDDIVTVVQDALSIWGVPPERLTLEVREETIMSPGAARDGVLGVLRALRKIGVRIAIDDFGSGLANLSRLGHLPVDDVKLDRSLIAAIGDDDQIREVARALASVAHAFGLKVVAEGVSDRALAELAAELGCDYLQGFVFTEPLAQADFLTWLIKYENQSVA